MRRGIRLVSLVAAVIAMPAAASHARPAPDAPPTTSHIVVLADGTDAASIARVHARTLGVEVTHVYRHALDGYAARLSAPAASALRRAPLVEWVERDRALRMAATTVPTGVARVHADASPTAAIDGVDDRVDADAAVLDTGVDLDHPDLNVVASRGKNCVSPLLAPDDINGHGTHVAGTIAALDDARGVVGVAPGARIWPVKVLGDAGFGLLSDAICGVDYVTRHASEIEVANMSLVGSGLDDGNCGITNTDSFHKAICRSVDAGVTYAVAAGNARRDVGATVPASYDEVITVSALADFDGRSGAQARSTCWSDDDDTFANYSNYGADIDLIAPGTCIRSTWARNGYGTSTGTSMATPHVAGAAALYASRYVGSSPAEIRAALIDHGSYAWIWPSQDRDKVQEPLLNVESI